MKAVLLGAAGAAVGPQAQAAESSPAPRTWRQGIEGQRIADLGDGTFLNPIMPGDHPDPTILKVGDAYYMTFSSFDASPGIIIWRSQDLVNWAPVGPALTKPIGSVWAMDLVHHRGRFYIYIPATPSGQQTIMVIHADRIEGPWSDPIDLHISGRIDPGHVVGEDGKRYLFVNGGDRVRLRDDGLATDGALEHAYDLWHYPDDWVVEMYSAEGPKLLRRDNYFYLIAAIGGTSGPPTGHMVVAARSRSVFGPWEQCPHNPIVRTTDPNDRWWSRGHATLVEGPSGDWWMVYHGYENGYRTLGRQTLLEPVEWTNDGWPRALGGDLSQPIAKPRCGKSGQAGQALSDDFSTNKFGSQWSFYEPTPTELARIHYEPRALRISGKGADPRDCSPLVFNAGDHAYEVSVTLEPQHGAQGGLLLFYSKRGFVGLGVDGQKMYTYNYGQSHSWLNIPAANDRVQLKITNDRQIVTMRYSLDGQTWLQHPWQLEVSGYHQNVLGDFLSLRPGLYAAGAGDVRFTDFQYRGLA
ncbi:MAG: family 43 glycosylhydrolase [Pseudomonadota bacterium]